MEEISTIHLENTKHISETDISISISNNNKSDIASTNIQNSHFLSETATVDKKWRNTSDMKLNMEKLCKLDAENSTEHSGKKVTNNIDTDTENKKSSESAFDIILHEDSADDHSLNTINDKKLGDNTCTQQMGTDIKSSHSLINAERLSQKSYNNPQLGETGHVRNSDIVNFRVSNEENKVTNVSTIYFNAKNEISFNEISGKSDKHPDPDESTFQSISTKVLEKSSVRFVTDDPQTKSDSCNEVNEKQQQILLGNNRTMKTSEIKLKPFSLYWSFGYNKTVPILNLTKKDHIIVFADSEAGVLFNYDEKTMNFLQGHYNSIACLATDHSGNWVVTADEGDDSAVIVWDINSYIPIYTLFGPHPKGTRLVAISSNARYLVTVSPWPDQIVQLWLWTLGTDKAEASLVLPDEYGRAQKLSFSPDISEHIILTTSTHVLFISFEGKQLKLHEPQFNLASKQNCFFTDSVYMTSTHIAVSATSTGHVYEWSDVPYQDSYTAFLFNNNKELLNYKKLQNEAITHILSVDNHVVTVNFSGMISFYDKRLCLLYWIKNFQNENIVSISFDLQPKSTPTIYGQHCRQSECSTKHETVNVIYSDATLEKKPFNIRNFIVSTVSGKVLHINYSVKKVEKLITCSDSPLTATDAYPNNHFICTGNASGTCILFDTKQKKTVITQKINTTASEETEISCLKYSYNGSVLACGMSDGSLWLLDPLLLKPKPDMPITNSTDAITKIVFSFNSMYLAHADESFCVTLYSLEKGIKMLNKYKAHYKRIRDIVFASNEDFYSISEDRFVIHYNIYRPDDVRVSPVTRIEQSAVPLSMCIYPKIDDTEQKLLISNSEFKYKLLKIKPAVKCCKTAQAPVTSSPVSFMMVVPETESTRKRYIIFHCDKHLGIQILPVDGNPFKYITTITSSKINNVCLSECGNFIFTTSKDGYNLTMWQINTSAADMLEETGGEGLNPYFHVIEGGQDGCLFYQMQQFFYLGRLRHQGDYPSIYRSVSDKLPICDLPDVLRAIGYFPSEFELQNIITEVSSSTQSESDIREIQFDDFVRLYINHRPATGISKQQLKDAFLVFAYKPDDDSEPYIHRTHFLNILKYNGERLPHTQVSTYLRTLTENSGTGIKDMQYECSGTECNDSFIYLNEKITFEDFFYDILGFSEEKANDDDGQNNS